MYICTIKIQENNRGLSRFRLHKFSPIWHDFVVADKFPVLGPIMNVGNDERTLTQLKNSPTTPWRQSLTCQNLFVFSCLVCFHLHLHFYNIFDMLTHLLSQVLFEEQTAHTVVFVFGSTIIFFFLFIFFFSEHKTASIIHSTSVAMTDNFLTLFRNDLWTCTRLWTMIGWDHTCSVVSLPTKTWQEYYIILYYIGHIAPWLTLIWPT